MALALEDVNKFFYRKKHPQEDGRVYFLAAHQKPEEKLGKSMRPTMIIRFNGFLLNKGLTGTGHKKALPCLRNNHEALKIRDEWKGIL
jgi:hypothetical protein